MISQVEDVLCDSSDSSDTTVKCNTIVGSPLVVINSQFKPISPVSSNSDQTCASPNNSVTADHVAEYLAELTTEMVSEMKSEIREMVSAVDELISPSGESVRTPSPDNEKKNKVEYGDSLTDVVINEGLNSITEGVEDCCKLKFKESRRSTVNSLSSQDSGINLSYCERDVSAERRNAFIKHKSKCDLKTDESCPLLRKSEKEKDDQESTEPVKVSWHCPPKLIWKPMMEVRFCDVLLL